MGNVVRVLVVEDEALICTFIEDALSDGGFEGLLGPFGRGGDVHVSRWPGAVSGAGNGRQPGDGINGWELARQIREITPGFPVVYMTSASAPDWKSQGVDGSLLIEKPFAPAQLAAAVSQLLDNRA